MCFSYKKNNKKTNNQDTSYKTDLDIWNWFRRENLHLIIKEIRYNGVEETVQVTTYAFVENPKSSFYLFLSGALLVFSVASFKQIWVSIEFSEDGDFNNIVEKKKKRMFFTIQIYFNINCYGSVYARILK